MGVSEVNELKMQHVKEKKYKFAFEIDSQLVIH